MNTLYEYDEGCLAVIGMAARLPGADDINEFWDNMVAGRQSMEPIPDETLAAGLHAEARHEPDYVAMRSTLKNFDLFDADFFGFSPRDASIMDPQHRLVLEYAWRAFENAGHEPRDAPGVRTSVYASSDMSGYLTGYLYHHILSGAVDVTEAVIGCDKDYLATRIAYKCDLKGPAMAVQSSCSSSLLSVHVACQALLAGECDRALVTACTVMLPENLGYIYLPGGMRSPDGRCRPYDAEANGTIFANGVIAVLLKRLADAQRDKDNIIAVVRATAATNDGFDKVGYTAPSIDGQTGAIKSALHIAGVNPHDVDFVEGHGTATPLGDPIEVAALKQAYAQEESPRQRPIILGSLKGNIGHLDAAAGLASFAKTALCLHHGMVPGTANFSTPNPSFGDLAPFTIRGECTPLEREGEASILGGVSAFGIGGTNVHAILQEAPTSPQRAPSTSRVPLLFSAHNEKAYELTRERLAEHFSRQDRNSSSPETSVFTLEDASFTLATGRKQQTFRGAIQARNATEALERLREHASLHVVRDNDLPLAFLFPGQGNLHPDMAKGFFAEEADFQERLLALSEVSVSAGGPDLVDLLKRCWSRDSEAVASLTETQTAQPLLFALEIALAQTLISRGIKPECMIGHSLGEYAAACVANVFSPEDGIRLVTARGKLMQSAPRGNMLVVSLNASRVREVLGSAFEGVEISLINSTANCVLTGPNDRLEACAAAIAEHGQRSIWLKTSHAFHSAAMEGILEQFRELASGMTLRTPEIPYVSNVTGTWIGDEAATPEYWVKHLRNPVQFADGLTTLHGRVSLGIEVGPGNVLRSLSSQQLGGKIKILPGLDPLGVSTTSDAPADLPERTLADIASEVWLNGGSPDWEAYYAQSDVRRCPLPETTFTPRRYWIAPGGEDIPGLHEAGERDGGIEKYARSCSTAYVAPETDVQKALATLWQELLFVDQVGIRDDFLELGGNSIQVMQMVRQAAGQGLSFSSKDVFDAKTIEELAKRVRSGAATREAVPGPVPVPSYLASLLASDQGSACHYRLFSCLDTFTLKNAGKLAHALAARYDALRMAWDGTSLRLAGVRETDWAVNNVDDLAQDKESLERILAGDCAAQAARLQPERLKSWGLTVLPSVDGQSGPSLLLLVRAAMADIPAMALLEQDILAFLNTGSLDAQAQSSWKLWLEDLTSMEGSNKEKAARAAALERWRTRSAGLGSAMSIVLEPGTETGRRETDTASDKELFDRLKEAAAVCRASTEEILASALGLMLAGKTDYGRVAHFMNDGRHLVMPSANPAGTVGAFVLRQPVAVPGELSPEEAIPLFKETLREFSDFNAAPWLTEQPHGSAGITVFWMGEQAGSHAQIKQNPAPHLVHAGSWRVASASRDSVLELVCWAEAGQLRARLVYPETFGQARADAFLREFMESVNSVSEQGIGNIAASRYILADFADSGLLSTDLDAILSQING